MKKVILIVSLLLFAGSTLYGGTKDPIAVLFQVKGNVEYTRNGEKWKKVRRNKFLFAGYQVRTGDNGSGKITNQKTGKNLLLHPNSLIVVTSEGLQAKKGVLADSEKANKLLAGLMKRFSKSQSYTTVRRGRVSKVKLDAARHIILTNEYPYLVWENLGSNYRYELNIDNKIYNVSPTNDEIVRVEVKPFAETKDFFINAYKGEKLAVSLKPFKSRGVNKNHSVHWMNATEKQQFNSSIKTIQENYPDNSFMLGSFFEKEQMWIAAMDQYKKYLDNNPDEIEMTPYLFRVYKKLKLKKVYKKELSEWTQAMKE